MEIAARNGGVGQPPMLIRDSLQAEYALIIIDISARNAECERDGPSSREIKRSRAFIGMPLRRPVSCGLHYDLISERLDAIASLNHRPSVDRTAHDFRPSGMPNLGGRIEKSCDRLDTTESLFVISLVF